jgi:hypothetical protein
MESISSSLRFSPPRVEVSLYNKHFHTRFSTNKFVWHTKSLSRRKTAIYFVRVSNYTTPHGAILLGDRSKSFHLPDWGRDGKEPANNVNYKTKTELRMCNEYPDSEVNIFYTGRWEEFANEIKRTKCLYVQSSSKVTSSVVPRPTTLVDMTYVATYIPIVTPYSLVASYRFGGI